MKTSTVVRTSWGIDPIHSEIHFKVKHMMVSTVTGTFNQFEGLVFTENNDFEEASISFSTDIDSIDTKNQQRDEHLKSVDFFHAEQFPKLSFNSTSFTKKLNGKYLLEGELNLRGHRQIIELEAAYNGTVIDTYGQVNAGFAISGKINRKDFGLKWNALTEAGGVMVSDEVRLVMNVQLVRQ